MSSGLIILIATSTAVVVIVLALLLSRLVRTVVEGVSNLAPDLSRYQGLFSGRSHRARRKLRASAAQEPDVDTGRSIRMKFRQFKLERGEPRVGEEARQMAEREGIGDGGAEYRQVGDEVTAVLTAAEQAAAQIRETALQEAERTRLDADEKAAATLDELQARRVEVDRYSEETRAAADAYAEETRRAADEQAAKRVSQADEQARRIQVEAEEIAGELEAEARRRRDALTEGAEGMEARIESVLTVFRQVITELDALLPPERRSGAGEPEPAAAKRLDDALSPASWHG